MSQLFFPFAANAKDLEERVSRIEVDLKEVRQILADLGPTKEAKWICSATCVWSNGNCPLVAEASNPGDAFKSLMGQCIKPYAADRLMVGQGLANIVNSCLKY